MFSCYKDALHVNLFSASPVYLNEPNIVSTVPADAIAPNSARPSAGIVLTDNSDMFFARFSGH